MNADPSTGRESSTQTSFPSCRLLRAHTFSGFRILHAKREAKSTRSSGGISRGGQGMVLSRCCVCVAGNMTTSRIASTRTSSSTVAISPAQFQPVWLLLFLSKISKISKYQPIGLVVRVHTLTAWYCRCLFCAGYVCGCVRIAGKMATSRIAATHINCELRKIYLLSTPAPLTEAASSSAVAIFPAVPAGMASTVLI